jgi:dTDP-4-dehydrorhamnose 3,5-epimerase
VEFEPLEVEGAFLVRPEPHADARGWFARVFSVEDFAAEGLEVAIEQVNLAVTEQPGTVRGLHYQLPPGAEAKLIRCVSGAIFDVVVDLRPGSSTFGRWAGRELTAEDGHAVYVPPGCAHGYQALTPGARALYHASSAYAPELERGIDHADPDLGIAWPLPPVNLSEKDRSLPGLGDAELAGD